MEAAIVHGAPAVGAGPGTIDLYVPNATQLSIALRRYGAANPISAVASIALPPVPQLTNHHTGRSEKLHRGWPVTHPVDAALDLAGESQQGDVP